MTSDEIRQLYLRFFAEKGHLIVPSSSLVPHGDPTLLLTSAGMVQFKPYFLGEPLPQGYSSRITTCQKCFRTTDIDLVGDTKHLTFFEMLGNFSIGDYFKREAIAWAWEFVTRRLKLPKERLWITIFLDDDEAFGYWREQGVPAERIRRYGEKDNFWGPAGEMGPCGPCSEIHYDYGEGVGCGRAECAPNCDCPRFLEIWNLVFVQYNQDREGKRTPLPKPHIDTGMGLERTAAVMQGKVSVYDTDVFTPLMETISWLAGVERSKDETQDKPLRVVAEHGRGIVFLIADGVVPSNEGRGYVLRRLLRRALVFGRRLGLNRPFLNEVVQEVIDQMGHVYPELHKNQEFILKMIEAEEGKFQETIDVGIGVLESTFMQLRNELRDDFPSFEKEFTKVLSERDIIKLLNDMDTLIDTFRRDCRAWGHVMISGGRSAVDEALKPADEALDEMKKAIQERRGSGAYESLETFKQRLGGLFQKVKSKVEATVKEISGVELFIHYDTYGFPPELTAEIVRERGFSVDMKGFEAEMEKQRERARAAHKFSLDEKKVTAAQAVTDNILSATEFTGYDQLACQARILSLTVSGKAESAVSEGQEVEVILDITPFYAEMGGQVADTGEIIGEKGVIQVTDTQWVRSGIIVHRGKVIKGNLFQGETVSVRVEEGRRLDIARNHTATHLLQAALRQVLGSHVQQRGSLVSPDRLRFDYSHLLTPTPEEMAQVQGLVNGWVRQNLPVKGQTKTYKEAVAQGAMALFGEKYGETVRAIQIGETPVSLELCGGTHLHYTGEVGFFIIISEGSIGSGLRRIEALTGRGAEAFITGRLATLNSLVKELQATPENVQEKLTALQKELSRERKQAQALERELLKKTVESLLSKVETVDGIPVLASRVSVSGPEAMREMGDWLRESLKSAVVVLGTVYNDKPSFLSLVTPDLVQRGFHAGEIVKMVAKIAGGGGGGRAELAQAGGKDKEKLDEALSSVKGIVQEYGRLLGKKDLKSQGS